MSEDNNQNKGFDSTGIWCLYVKTINVNFFQDDISSILVDNFKDRYVTVLDMTLMLDATEAQN